MAPAFLIVLFLTVAAACPSSAQVNIETFRDKSGVSGAARLSFSSDIGNVDVVRSDGAGNLTVDREQGTFLAVLRGAAGFLGGTRYASSGVLHLRYTRKWRPRVHPEAFVQGDYDRARRLDGRSLVGAGLRWRLLRSEAHRLAVGTALMWERERLDLQAGDGHDDVTSGARGSLYLNMTLRSTRGVTLATTTYAQPLVTDPGDVRWLGTAELTTPLVGRLTQTTVVDFRVDSDPPQGVKRVDARVSASFGVRFGKS
jgi:hypothetical protein